MFTKLNKCCNLLKFGAKLNQKYFLIPKNLSSEQKSRKKSKMSSTEIFGCDSDIVWMDMEMSGLDVNKDKIIEVSVLITDKNLNIKSEGPSIAINQPQEVFDNMNTWCKKHHNDSGLVEKCLKSDITEAKAGEILLDYLKANIPKKKCPLAGNSIYMDRLFLRQNYLAVDEYLHYRIIDVSTIKELAQRWNPSILKCAPQKKFAHRTLDDIIDSINELKYYREAFLKTTDVEEENSILC